MTSSLSKCINGKLKLSLSIAHEDFHSSGTNKFTKAFDDYLGYFKDHEANYLILMENPLSWETYVYNPSGKGGYISAISRAFFGSTTKENRIKKWQEKGILILDIYSLFTIATTKSPIGIEISSKYRDAFQRPLCGMADPYAVWRLKISFDMMTKRIKVSKDCKIALAMPEKTSLPLFNHYGLYTKENLEIKGINRTMDFAPFFRELNSTLFYAEYPHTIIPRHKINTMGASNQAPDTNLLKIALDL